MKKLATENSPFSRVRTTGALLLLLLLPAAAMAAPGWLGIGVADVTADKVAPLKLKEERGVEILTVQPNSPAAQAGLKERDVVLEFNGARVEGVEQFQRMVRETPPGRTARLLISRDGATQTISVKLGERQHAPFAFAEDVFKEFTVRVPRMDPPKIMIHPPRIEMPKFELDLHEFSAYRTSRLGIDGETLTKQLGEYFGVPNGEGVLVRSVEGDSPAEKAGIKAGDVLIKIDGERVASIRDLRNLVRDKHGKTSVPLTVIRNKRETTVTVNLEGPEPRGGVLVKPQPKPKVLVRPDPKAELRERLIRGAERI